MATFLFAAGPDGCTFAATGYRPCPRESLVLPHDPSRQQVRPVTALSRDDLSCRSRTLCGSSLMNGTAAVQEH